MVLNHMLNELYDESSKPKSKFIATSMPPMASVKDFIGSQGYGYGCGIGGGQFEIKSSKSLHSDIFCH